MPTLNALYGRWRPRLRAVGQNVPMIDVILPCCNEEIEIILDTVRAALNLDYPKHRYRVLVTDDGASPKVAQAIAQIAKDRPNLFYTTRKKLGPEGYKAGNLNHALRVLNELPSGPAEFVACLDADMIAEKRWLRSLVPHLVQDPKLGVVCPPQVRYINFRSMITLEIC